jgi:hypothetical protein
VRLSIWAADQPKTNEKGPVERPALFFGLSVFADNVGLKHLAPHRMTGSDSVDRRREGGGPARK